jgi:chemotaxis protein methyltransferase CheR
VSGQFDLIFCRNVMIYFDAETKLNVARQLLRHLAPDGLLFVGLAESLRFLELDLRCIEPGVYTRAGHSIRSDPTT